MTEEQKKLLLIDLCGRLPYGVVLNIEDITDIYDQKLLGISLNHGHCIYINGLSVDNNGYDPYATIKPWLFPLSSMTKEQKKELEDMGWSFDNFEINNTVECTGPCRQYVAHTDCSALVNWLNKNHFDYRGLIEMKLAIDATRMGIYK